MTGHPIANAWSVTPSGLWIEAQADYPDDPEKARARYRDLMVERGYDPRASRRQPRYEVRFERRGWRIYRGDVELLNFGLFRSFAAEVLAVLRAETSDRLPFDEPFEEEPE